MNKEPVKMAPGDDLHLTLLMAPQGLNFVTGKDREHLLTFGRAAFDAGQTSKCLHQIAEPAAATPDVSISVQEWRDVCHQFFISHNRAPLIDDPDFFNSIAKIAVNKFAATQPAAQGLDAKRFLSESDYENLWRFEGMASDGEGYDISKDRMKRLAELGVVRWCGKDRYSITSFGQYVLEAAMVTLPLETYEEASARCNAEFKARIERLNAEALAAQSKGDVLAGCAAGKDGDCTHAQCPQLRDNEPQASGRHCPLDAVQAKEGGAA